MKQMDPQRNPCQSMTAYNESVMKISTDRNVDSSITEESVLEQGPYQSEDNMSAFVQIEGGKVKSNPHFFVEQSIEHMSIVDHSSEPVMEHLVEDIGPAVGKAEEMQIGPGMVVESVEIPSSNVYIYDNPVYLNRLMKDNTCGKRVRHDAPYIHRLGPWDDKSSHLLIQLLREYPVAYFILGKNCKRTEAWELIRYKLSEAGYQFTVLQIRMRWRELCKRYRNVVNHNELHDKKRTCQYFDELNDLFGIWDSQATQLLIQQFGANSAKRLGQNGGTRMRYKAWEQVREALSRHGFEYTADQVYGRWNALVTLYRRMIEHNSDPSNEPMTVAFQDAIESVYKYVPERKTKLAKIRGKHGQSLKIFKKKWTLPVERILLRGYRDNIELFIQNGNKKEVWERIVKLLEEGGGYHTTMEKVRTRFCELSKQYEAMLHHNSQPGTLYRESRHHEILADIYNLYNCWPHDGSTMKSDNFGSLRIRQMKAQIMWSNEESQAVLALYPQALIRHLKYGDQPPLEELWVHLAKDLFSTYNYCRQPYEIEEHIALLRQGYKSKNPFPFKAEMEFLEETEHTLCFSPESPSTVISQLVPYWSHAAAHCLLDHIIHYCQEGDKHLAENMFNAISSEMENLGYRYTAEECQQYYYLLKRIYKKKDEASKKDKDLHKFYPYMDKMNELKTVISQAEYPETDDVYHKIISAASSNLDELKRNNENSRRELLDNMLLKLKMHMMLVMHIRPPPPVKVIAHNLLKFLREKEVTSMLNNNTDVMRVATILSPHTDILNLISQNGLQQLYQNSHSQPEAVKRKKKIGEKHHKSTSIQWTSDNICIMLNTVREWQLLCHDDAELTDSRAVDQPLWDEVAYKLSRRFRKCPTTCQMFFISMCHDYTRVRLFDDPSTMASSVWYKNQKVRNLLCTILIPIGSCDAEWDIRDAWWASEAGGWSQNETLELLFTVRELWPGEMKMDWELISLMMNAGGYKRKAECCYSTFHRLYSGYQRAFRFNQKCSIRERRRPPFYFKIHSLFGYREEIPRYHSEPKTNREQDLDIDEQEVIEVLLVGLKDMKNFTCHSVPRRPLLMALAQFLNNQYQHLSTTFTPYQIWHLLVQLHCAQRETVQESAKGPFGPDIDGLWQNHPNPVVAYGFHAVPTPGWHMVSDWSMEELSILVKAAFDWEINSSKDKTMGEVVSEALQTEGYNKSVMSCCNQWKYMVNIIRHGGYQKYKDQINLVNLAQTELFRKQPNSQLQRIKKNTFCEQEKEEKTDTIFLSNVNSKENDAILKQCGQQGSSEEVTDKEKIAVDKVCLNETSENYEGPEFLGVGKSEEILHYMKGSGNLENEKVSEIMKPAYKTVSKKFKVPLEKSTYQHTNISKKNKIQVEVLSVNEAENFKVIECLAKEAQPSRVIKLHYPLTHSLPANIEYINIPRMLVYPAYVSPGAPEMAQLRTRDNSYVSSKNISTLKLENKRKVLPKDHNEMHTMQIQPGLRESSQSPQKGKTAESSPTQVKKHNRISSLNWLRKRKSSRMKLKRLRKEAQLQRKKTREVSQIPFKKRYGETLQEPSRNMILESQELPLKKRLAEFSDLPISKIRDSSQVQIKNTGESLCIKDKKFKQDSSYVQSKKKQKDTIHLPLKKRTNGSSRTKLEQFYPQMKNPAKSSHSCKNYEVKVGCQKSKENMMLNDQEEIELYKKTEEQHKRDIMNLINQYSYQCDQEEERVLKVFKESQLQEMLALECILSLVQEITH